MSLHPLVEHVIAALVPGPDGMDDLRIPPPDLLALEQGLAKLSRPAELDQVFVALVALADKLERQGQAQAVAELLPILRALEARVSDAAIHAKTQAAFEEAAAHPLVRRFYAAMSVGAELRLESAEAAQLERAYHRYPLGSDEEVKATIALVLLTHALHGVPGRRPAWIALRDVVRTRHPRFDGDPSTARRDLRGAQDTEAFRRFSGAEARVLPVLGAGRGNLVALRAGPLPQRVGSESSSPESPFQRGKRSSSTPSRDSARAAMKSPRSSKV